MDMLVYIFWSILWRKVVKSMDSKLVEAGEKNCWSDDANIKYGFVTDRKSD